ncbi:hypothetical protein Tco_0673889 [Tanacetum coccineum]
MQKSKGLDNVQILDTPYSMGLDMTYRDEVFKLDFSSVSSTTPSRAFTILIIPLGTIAEKSVSKSLKRSRSSQYTLPHGYAVSSLMDTAYWVVRIAHTFMRVMDSTHQSCGKGLLAISATVYNREFLQYFVSDKLESESALCSLSIEMRFARTTVPVIQSV